MSNFDNYLQKLAKIEPLSYEEECLLLEKAAEWDALSKWRIAESRLKEVITIIWDQAHIWDHILSANVGVLRAIDLFIKNPTRWKSLDECIEEEVRKEILEDS